MYKEPSGVKRATTYRTDEVPSHVLLLQQNGCCEGYCRVTGECSGEVRAIRVCGWGWFAYCETARKEDLKRGFTLCNQLNEEVHA